VINLGLPKTGTSSLQKALKKLGWKNILHGISRFIHMPFDSVTDIIEKHEGCLEIYGVFPFHDLISRFPQAYYINTIRDFDSWLNSCAYQFNERRKVSSLTLSYRLKRFGKQYYDEQNFRNWYEQYIKDIKQHTHIRILDIDIIKGEGYEKLCPFLGCDILDEEFPIRNMRKHINKNEG
jgi:hypothetical protein